jgi:Tol biopolymer transport system component
LAFSPTWSPDGKQIAFSTGEMPFPERNMTGYESAVYVVNLDGSHERRIAAGALPDWSPDGKTIAYFAPGCGQAPDDKGRIRLVTPTGRDVTPPIAPCNGIGPTGHPVPAWSPDGRQIAVGTDAALYLMQPDGTGLRQLRRGSSTRWLAGYIRPAWRQSDRRSETAPQALRGAAPAAVDQAEAEDTRLGGRAVTRRDCSALLTLPTQVVPPSRGRRSSR